MPDPSPCPRSAADELDLLDGDEDFWAVAELLERTPQAAPSHQAQQSGSVGPRPRSALTSSFVGKHVKTAASKPSTAGDARAGPKPRSSADGHQATQSSTAGAFRQRNLFGEIITDASVAGPSTSRSRANGPASRDKSGSGQRPSDTSNSQAGESTDLTAQMRFKTQKVTKQWDFSQPVRKTIGTKKASQAKRSKGKARAKTDDEDDDDFSDFSVSSTMLADEAGTRRGDVSSDSDDDTRLRSNERLKAQAPGRTAPMKLSIDLEAAKTWIYPTNKSFRAYQYNIVQRALFNNVLVALPTGLGKTFIAAVVILNFYRWFPEGKIIFVAPTKPLVAQQQIACHGICGLPWDQAIELTGSTKSRMRGNEWQSKRIFYMTPQTFENDLMSSSCNPRDVVCVVVDEAHRATGNYAYGCVIRHIMRYNRHVRVLALTATPGAKSEKVQEVVDSLHIGHIEIRSEDALDIRAYVHKKTENRVLVPPGPVVGPLQEALANMMRTHLDPAIGEGLLRNGTDPKTLHPFTLREMLRAKSKPHQFDKKPYLRACLSELATLADCMQTLIIYSVEMFRSKFFEAAAKAQRSQGPKCKLYSKDNKHYMKILQILEDAKDPKTNQVVHPKMTALLETVQKHFVDHDHETEQAEIAHWTEGEGLRGRPAPRKRDTKVMVFCHYRQSVSELVDFLNAHGLKAVSFVGQASSKGGRGCTQKQQEQIIQDFKAGKTNVIVATSIGEEGLDIGEIDLIVCYDAQKDPVRMLQRIGRTGRQRDGKIFVLLSEGKEENNWQQSKESYKTVQKEINAGYSCELYDDVERLVPKDIHPKCIKQVVDEHEFDPELINQHQSQRWPTSAHVKKMAKDPMRHIPKGSILGFLKASEIRSDLHAKSRAPPTSASSSDQDEAGQSSLARVGRTEGDRFDRSSSKQNAVGSKGPMLISRPAVGRNATHRQATIYIPKRPLSSTSAEDEGVENSSRGTPASIDSSYDVTTPVVNAEGDDESMRSNMSSSGDTANAPHRGAPHPLVLKMAAEAGMQVNGSKEVARPTKQTALYLEDEDEDEEPPLRSTRAGKQRSARQIMQSSPASGISDGQLMPPPALRQRNTNLESSPASKDANKRRRDENDGGTLVAKKRSKLPKKPIRNSQTSRALFAYEAERDTDEERHGEKDENDEGLDTDEADSSDLEHVGHFEPTQHPDHRYDQRSVYAQSLLTQTSLTPFKRGPRVFGLGGYFGEGGLGTVPVSAPMGGSDDHYTQDSFVVADDDEIQYELSEDGS